VKRRQRSSLRSCSAGRLYLARWNGISVPKSTLSELPSVANGATIDGQKIRMDELSEQLRGASPALSVERANRKRIISELQKFYVASSALMDKRFKNDDPSVTTSFEEYRKAEEDWVRRTGLWIRENMASGAEDFFLDGRNSTSVMFADAYNQEHNTLLSELIGYRRNLVALIQSNAWDK